MKKGLGPSKGPPALRGTSTTLPFSRLWDCSSLAPQSNGVRTGGYQNRTVPTQGSFSGCFGASAALGISTPLMPIQRLELHFGEPQDLTSLILSQATKANRTFSFVRNHRKHGVIVPNNIRFFRKGLPIKATRYSNIYGKRS